MTEFSEDRFFDAYKTIRNNFRKYDTTAFIKGCFNYLHLPAKNAMEQLQKHPWLVFLLIKWVISDEQSFESGKAIPSNSDIRNAIQRMLDLGGKARLPSEFEHLTLFLRSLAYQQFIYQEEFRFSHLARQFILFVALPPDHFIKTEFRNLTGLSVETFLELSLMLFMRFSGEDVHAIDQNFFSPLIKKYSIPEINIFLRIFSKRFSDIKDQVNARNQGKVLGEEYYEQTPFLAFPLIEDGIRFICSERHVLLRCIEHFIYDRMRVWDAQKFMNEFGYIFERSVETAIQHTKLSYTTEAELRATFGDDKKLVDFVITDGNSSVFVDAKAVEMAYQGKVAHLCEVVEDKAQSIFKAIEQANEVMTTLSNSTNPHFAVRNKNSNYLIVVTYKDLYLGNGATLYEGVAKASLDAIRAKYVNGGIPLENMYFLNVDEFEMFAEAVANGRIGLVEGLEKAKANDLNPQTRKFGFSLHLASWNIPIGIPTYLQDRAMFEIDKIKPFLE
ncbi:hypothetical protein SAMN04515618_11793 [Collimonas sp. OK307]|uniref:GapS1 family protein n=1 Tax=Collimonas sp. OK307 TaxID=1801620 RepID=UPI0008EB879D|nr:hypothetical protein [Collimonas sp. OK307]SFI32797.1 hypothetical protein SAMN04515618_11793 [Collimonas sp. OK307]